MNRAGSLSYNNCIDMEKYLFEIDTAMLSYFPGVKALKYHWVKWHLMEQARLWGWVGGAGDQSIERKHQDAVKFKDMTKTCKNQLERFTLICDYFTCSEQPDYLTA